MTNETLRASLRQFILETFLFAQDPHPLKDTVSLMGNGYMDSMGVLELLDFLQTHFKVDVKSHEMTPQNLDSINNLVRFVQQKIAHSQSPSPLLEPSL